MDTFTVGDCAIGTIRELIDQMAMTRGEQVFLISPETGKTLTFAGLRDQTKAISTLLRGTGLERGGKVAFLLDNGLFTVQLFLGTMYGGFVSVPLNVRVGVTQLVYTLDHCDAEVLFVEDQYAALAKEVLATVSRPVRVIPANVDEFAQEVLIPALHADETVQGAPAAEDIALLMYTSGSVGVPKAAIHSHRTVLAHGRNSIASHQLTAADRSLLVLPMYHINAECVTLMPTLLSAGSVVVPHHFNVSQFWDWLDEFCCTWSALVPTIISQLLDWKDPRADQREWAFRRIRFLRSSSAPLSPSLQREFLDKFKLLLIQAMGSSEAGNIFSNPQPPGENKIGTPGPAWGFETRIINPEGVAVAVGEPGEVLVRGAAVMQGYYKDLEQTEAVLDAEGWLHTGDLAYQDQDGYFFIIGRSKELIIKGGMNIAPRQIDEVLESHPAVLEAAVVGVPDHYVGEDLVAFAVLRTGMEVDEREMLGFCESRLGHFKTPTRIHFVEDLPKGPSGKVQRLRLLDQAAQLALAGPLYTNGNSSGNGNGQVSRAVQPSAAVPIEETISQSWAHALGLPVIGENVNFFALGGHSLTAIQCLSRIRERLPVALSLSDFFENPTVEQQAALVKQRLAANGVSKGQIVGEQSSATGQSAPTPSIKATELSPIPVHGRSWSHPLSLGQRRIWFFEEMAPGVPLYNECEAVRLVGHLQADAVEQALNLIIARHEMLRTTIQADEESPVAIVHATWPLRIKRIDLSNLAPARQEAEVQRLLVDEPRAPYHLDTAPGIRATLVRLSPAEHVFILMMHHLVCDWAAVGQLWREFSSAYSALVRGERLAAPSLPIQYGDYAVWQQQRMVNAGFNEDLDFWEDNLRGAPERLELPSDRPRLQVPSYRGAKKRFRLGARLTEELRNLSRQEKTSPFTIFAAAFNTLLYRYSGSEDILLGIPIGDRERSELQPLIGFLLHTHVLRTRLSGGMKFRDLLPIVQSGLLALYSHREVPFDQVVSRISPPRSLSHSPLFQVMLNWRDGDQQLSRIGVEGLVVESVLAEARTSKFDLTMMLTDDEDEVWLEAEYNIDLFDDDRIFRMFGHYQTLLKAIAADPDRRLDELPLLTEAERQQSLVEWNATEVTYPRDLCIHQLFEQQAARTPEAVAVVFGGYEVTYQQLDQRSNQLAHHLRKLGVKTNSLVAICVERSIEMMVGILGILKAGAGYVPLDPGYPQQRLAFMLIDSRATLILTQRKLRDGLPQNYQTLCLDTDWQRIAEEEKPAPTPSMNSCNLAYVIYTSGSTGKPKGVEITHASVVNLLCSMRKRPGFEANDILLAATTLSFDMSVVELFLPLTVGAKLVIAGGETATDGRSLLELLYSSRATVFQATPITFRILLEAGWASGVSRVKVWCGGEALPRALADEIMVRADELWNCYGPTEITVYASISKVSSDGPVTIGRPIDNTQLYILDANGGPCPIGRPGELHVGGAGLARGYFGRPELTTEKFVADPFSKEHGSRLYKTGDLSRFLPNGEVEYLGRMDHQVKIHGFRIELGEIESALRQNPKVAHCVVTARETSTGDKQLVAYVMATAQDAVPGVGELRDFLKRSLPEYMIPQSFVTLEKLPLTSNGKIDRKALPAPEPERASSEPFYIAPRTPTEDVLAAIWCEVLGVKEIGVRDEFFTLGGHSLQVTQLLAKIERLFNQRVSVPAFFQNPTIEGLSEALREPKPGSNGRQLTPLRVGSAPGTLFFLDAEIGLCRLAKLLTVGPSAVATAIPLHSSELQALERAGKLPSLESIAAAHVALIRTYHGSGPCLLVGYSFGGVLAYEVAQQLHRDGVFVEMVMLLDSWASTPFWWQKLKVLSLDLERKQNPRPSQLRSMMRTIPERVTRLASLSKSHGPSSRSSGRASLLFGEMAPTVPIKLLRRIRDAYEFKRLDTRAVLFRCQDDIYSTHTLKGQMGWEGLFTRGLEIIETPGNHAALLQEPNLQELATRIDSLLNILGGRDQHTTFRPIQGQA
jgi:amino acid adenylation domain-containing protein